MTKEGDWPPWRFVGVWSLSSSMERLGEGEQWKWQRKNLANCCAFILRIKVI